MVEGVQQGPVLVGTFFTTSERGNPFPKLKGPHRSVGDHIPNSRGQSEAWESISKLQGPHQSVGVHHLNSRGHTKARESISPTQGSARKQGGPYPQLKGPQRSVGVHIPNARRKVYSVFSTVFLLLLLLAVAVGFPAVCFG